MGSSARCEGERLGCGGVEPLGVVHRYQDRAVRAQGCEGFEDRDPQGQYRVARLGRWWGPVQRRPEQRPFVRGERGEDLVLHARQQVEQPAQRQELICLRRGAAQYPPAVAGPFRGQLGQERGAACPRLAHELHARTREQRVPGRGEERFAVDTHEPIVNLTTHRGQHRPLPDRVRGGAPPGSVGTFPGRGRTRGSRQPSMRCWLQKDVRSVDVAACAAALNSAVVETPYQCACA